MQNLILLGSVKFLHDLFTVMWIGGMIIMAAVILPSVKKQIGPGPEAKKLIATMKSRLSMLTYVSMIGLLVTGLLLSNSSPLFTGFLDTSTQYSLLLTMKHIIIALMVIISLVRSLGIERMKLEGPKEQKVGAMLLLINVILGISILLISGILGAESIIASLPT
ncbi:MAG: hypothetical protein KAU48_10180 [Candidatus Thorarchaeota archaeon]|nr:hypothetical protein [Candidatus Thorarchaeota archaeon]